MSDPTLLVLSSLAEGDKHGYAIMRDVEKFSGLRLGPGTLYGAIMRLEERGWVARIETTHRRQPYRITETGRAHLTSLLTGLDRVVSTGLSRIRPPYQAVPQAGAAA